MRKLQYWLVALILIQFVIAAGMLWHTQKKTQAYLPDKPLFNFKIQNIDKISIQDGTDTLTLVKSDGTWFLPNLHNLPVDQSKLDTILTKVNNLKTSWPVATSSTGHTRFEVADNKFQRRIELHKNKKVVADLYVGTSIGLRKYHIRKAGEDAVFTGEIANYELTTRARPWLDPYILSAKEIEAISGHDYALEHIDGQWNLAENDTFLAEKAKLDTQKAQKLAGVLEHLRVQNVIAQSLATAPQPDIRLRITDSTGSWDYEFREMNGDYFVSRNDWDLLFQVNKLDFEHIQKISLTELALQVEPETFLNEEEVEETQEQFANTEDQGIEVIEMPLP